MNICIFCGASEGKSPDYINEARTFGGELAKQGWGLVYGGASIGCMGAFADGAMAEKGNVIGVIPTFLIDWEVAHDNLSELIKVEGMHERKQVMYDRSDAFVAYPGGLGTLDELCEIATWAQLKSHKKPIYIYNYLGFFDKLLEHVDLAVEQGFISQDHKSLLQEVKTREELLSSLSEL